MNNCQRCGNTKWHASIRVGSSTKFRKWIDLCHSCEFIIQRARRFRKG